MSNTVRVVKLITGEELVGRVIHLTGGSISLDRPMMFKSIPTVEKEDWSGTLIPWLKTSKSKQIVIPLEHIIFEGEPTEEVEKHYLSWVTGLTFPHSGILVD